ncbi:MAG: class I SAM-dependent methyltransferase [Methanomassiliicoccales archaeon]|jgi:SAM-dependent methyltransferase
MTDWDREWKAAQDRSPLKVTPRNAAAWRNFWNVDADYYLEEVQKESVLYDKVVERLLKEGWVEETDDVLDIGAGPGTFALPLSNHVRSVTALDEAERMLGVLDEECRRRDIKNISTVHKDWLEHSDDKGYDLVLSALNPAIKTSGDLLRMESAGRSRSCIITACPSNWMGTRNDLWTKVVGEFLPSDANSVKYPLNILLESQRDLELFRVTADTETRFRSQKVIDHYTSYFGIFTDMTPEKRQIVKEYVLSRSKDDIFISRRRKCLNMLCWKGPGSA